eukprot:CAMPEP_0194318376 /NCGR_PEP_ID=MMETSP0171-20130528/14989_1 /TAXON_ID=218684 /ORGANISM="Corethron pennatum, Strain L29A3" /LENGTH=196 /DNA_ID=CAMNT_0039075261 /DNA_START=88 /DNA_END=677 /DNA_ORIENTATION=+
MSAARLPELLLPQPEDDFPLHLTAAASSPEAHAAAPAGGRFVLVDVGDHPHDDEEIINTASLFSILIILPLNFTWGECRENSNVKEYMEKVFFALTDEGQFRDMMNAVEAFCCPTALDLKKQKLWACAAGSAPADSLPSGGYFGKRVQYRVLQFAPARRSESHAKGLQDHKLSRQIGHEDGRHEHTELIFQRRVLK